MKTLIILNPVSAKGRAMDLRKEIESEFKKLKLDYQIHISKSLQDMMNATKKNLKNGFTNFIGVGGDGTIHYMANILAGTDKNLGVIPTGSGNDIAVNLGLPSDVKSCCRIIKKGATKRLDLGLINDKYYYLCIAGSGFDSQVNDLANNTRLPLKGPAKYSYSVYKTLITFKSKKFFMDYNNSQREVFGMMITASNMPSYGGGMRITPDADPEDGLFDICIIKRMSKLHFIKVFPKVYEGKHIEDSNVEIFRTSYLKLDSEYRFSVFADGEYICKLPASFKVAPKKLNFIVSS
jgi:YegS/Rv2252/BmrU family lipid kinase